MAGLVAILKLIANSNQLNQLKLFFYIILKCKNHTNHLIAIVENTANYMNKTKPTSKTFVNKDVTHNQSFFLKN